MVSNDKDVLDRFFELFDVLKPGGTDLRYVQLAAAALLMLPISSAAAASWTIARFSAAH